MRATAIQSASDNKPDLARSRLAKPDTAHRSDPVEATGSTVSARSGLLEVDTGFTIGVGHCFTPSGEWFWERGPPG
jgi:hypothetical protein